MQREVTDAEGTRWTCAQAFAGTGGEGGGEAAGDGAAGAAAALAARLAGGPPGTVAVVCTPDGGQQSVRVALGPDWADAMDDAALAAAIVAARDAGQGALAG